jgi:protein TIF31
MEIGRGVSVQNIWMANQQFQSPRFKKVCNFTGPCHKVVLELDPIDYDMDNINPFNKVEIISMVPLYKQVACSSTYGQTLLES